jgi:hypothetical protein
MCRHVNVYADTSGVRRFDYLAEAVRRAGPHKLLFGSDGPWLHPGLELNKVRLFRLPPAQPALILGGNAFRLLRQTPARTEPSRRRRTLTVTNARTARNRMHEVRFRENVTRATHRPTALTPNT